MEDSNFINVEFDVQKFRKLFPSKLSEIRFFDNACQTIPMLPVIEEHQRFLTNIFGCDRGSYYHSSLIDRLILEARKSFGEFFNVEHPEKELSFTLNGTHALNTIIQGFPWKRNDKILTTYIEHNSVESPVQRLKDELKVQIVRLPVRKSFVVASDVKECFRQHPEIRLVVLAGMDNIFGSIRPIKEIIQIAHSVGAKVLIDGAQMPSHTKVDIREWNPDFMTFSCHKFFGLTGVGIMYIRSDLSNNIKPLVVGGGTVKTTESSRVLVEPPERFEAGIRNVAGIIASSKSIPYIIEAIENGAYNYVHELTRYCFKMLEKIPQIYFLDEDYERCYNGIITFGISGIDSRELGTIIDELSRCSTRTGSHCQTTFFKLVREPDLKKKHPNEEVFLCRISFAPYNTKDEIDVLYETLKEMIDTTK